MTSCCQRRRMRWSGATGAIARCKNKSTEYAHKHRSVHAWRWTCGAKPKAKGANKPSTPYMRHVLPEATRYPCYSLPFFQAIVFLFSGFFQRLFLCLNTLLPFSRNQGCGMAVYAYLRVSTDQQDVDNQRYG